MSEPVTAEEVLKRIGVGEQMPAELRAQSARLAHVAHPHFRTDLWVRCFDGLYRFWLKPEQLERLEQEFAYTDEHGMRRASGILRVYGAIAKGRYELDGRSVGFAAEGEASVRECRRIITEALVGGHGARVDGKVVGVDRGTAHRLVESYLTCAPVEESWNLAFVVLHTIIHGRPKTDAEEGKPSSLPIIPRDDDDSVIQLTSASDVAADA